MYLLLLVCLSVCQPDCVSTCLLCLTASLLVCSNIKFTVNKKVLRSRRGGGSLRLSEREVFRRSSDGAMEEELGRLSLLLTELARARAANSVKELATDLHRRL